MIRNSLGLKQLVISQLLRGKINKKGAAKELRSSLQTIYRYLDKVKDGGLKALRDQRHSNYGKLTPKQIVSLLEVKKEGLWRSARKALEITNINSVGIRQVQRVWVKHGLNKINLERIKPLVRFVAQNPNDLWQADIQGKIHFPYLGGAYLIANLDDCSRFILGGKWFSKQNQMNVFRVWYYCLFRWGLPKAMLQDKGSQYKSANPKGEANYQYFAKILGIELKWAPRAQTKGKIERFWRFVQRDFVRENLHAGSFAELNKNFFAWQIKYNEEFRSDGLKMNKRTPAEVYLPSERRKPGEELAQLLTITLRRYVYRDSTISLFGIRYKVPPGYIGCRIWLYLRGDKISLEAGGKIILRFRLKV